MTLKYLRGTKLITEPRKYNSGLGLEVVLGTFYHIRNISKCEARYAV